MFTECYFQTNSAHSKGNFTLFSVICVTQNFFFRQNENFSEKMTQILKFSFIDNWVILRKSAFLGNHYIPERWNHSPIFFA